MALPPLNKIRPPLRKRWGFSGGKIPNKIYELKKVKYIFISPLKM